MSYDFLDGHSLPLEDTVCEIHWFCSGSDSLGELKSFGIERFSSYNECEKFFRENSGQDFYGEPVITEHSEFICDPTHIQQICDEFDVVIFPNYGDGDAEWIKSMRIEYHPTYHSLLDDHEEQSRLREFATLP
jgi:hypothetical protein